MGEEATGTKAFLGGRKLLGGSRRRSHIVVAGLVLLLLIFGGLSSATFAEEFTNHILKHDIQPPAPDDDSNSPSTVTYAWRNISSLGSARANPATVVLVNGDILVTGGLIAPGTVTATSEIFNATNGVWKPGPTMQSKRIGHTATLLRDGTVLVTGGDTGTGATASAELLNLSSLSSSPLPSMSVAREVHAAILLSNGKVLVSGGTDFLHSTWFHSELYDPATHAWLPGGSMAKPRLFFALQKLPEGDILAIGGDSNGTSERYSPSTNSWSGLAQMIVKRFSFGSAVLMDGRILAAGGIVNGSALKSAELYTPSSGLWSATGSMSIGRGDFSLTPIRTGDVLAAGSKSGAGTTSSAELFHPSNGSWSSAAPMHKSRGAQGFALGSNGTVFEMGGWSGSAITSSAEAYMPVAPVKRPELCRPIDIVPLVEQVKGLRGNSANGLISKLEAAQEKFDSGDNATCINIMNAFHNQLRAFINSGHISLVDALILHDAYSSVIKCLGGTPKPLVSASSIPFLLWYL